MYSIDVFQAERHTAGSDYGLTLAGFVRVSSVCSTTCGDGIVAGSEACDNGTNNHRRRPPTARGCTTSCTLAPYCGDDDVQAKDGEQCDDGTNLATYGGTSSMVCGPGCKYAPYCGDGQVQNRTGEVRQWGQQRRRVLGPVRGRDLHEHLQPRAVLRRRASRTAPSSATTA